MVEILPDGFFTDVPPDKYFVLRDGRTVKNIAELITFLKDMDTSLFTHHVNNDRNDFAVWIRDIIDASLGEELELCKQKDEFVKAIEKRLNKPKKEDWPLLKFPHFGKSEKKEEERHDIPVPDAVLSVKLNEILEKEREIEAREKIIQGLEERIEKKLEGEQPKSFFTKEFIEGILIGVLILFICGLVYLKFFMPY